MGTIGLAIAEDGARSCDMVASACQRPTIYVVWENYGC
jgi:hypothetical protein